VTRKELLPYRDCVGIMLFNPKGRVLIAQRIGGYAKAWQMPQGGIDSGEQAIQAAYRELREEIGTNRAELIDCYPKPLLYDLPDDLVGKIWKGRYRGQRQHWFAMRFTGQDQEINIDTDHPEFNCWRWCTLEKLPELVVPFKRHIYVDLITYFAHLPNQVQETSAS